MSQPGLQRKNYPLLGESVYQGMLSNGQQVVLIPKQGFQEVYGAISVAVGSLDTMYEKDGKIITAPVGMAHFLEHKLFEKEHTRDLMQLFSEQGADANAYTGHRQTIYLFSSTKKSSENLSLLQQLVCQPYFTAESVEREKQIITQEIEMYLDDPDYCVYAGVLEQLYPETALAVDIAGTISSIQEIDPASLYAYYSAFYQHSQMTILVVGAFDVDELWQDLLDMSVDNFVDKNKKTVKNVVNHLPVISEGQSVMEIAVPKLGIGFRGVPSRQDYTFYEYRIALTLFFNMLYGWTSDLHQDLYEKGQIDSSLSIQIEVQGAFQHVIMTVDTKYPGLVYSKLTGALQHMTENADISEEHLSILKKELYGDFVQQLDSIEWLASEFLQSYSAGETVFDLPQILDAMSFEQVLSIGKQFIEMGDRTKYMIFPKNDY